VEEAFGACGIGHSIPLECAGLFTPADLKQGKGAIREAYEQLFAELPHAAFDVKKQVFGDDLLFLERGR
jgi:hypothetical protein